MDHKQAKAEMVYRIIKIVLLTMKSDDIITGKEYEVARQKLVRKLKPLVGSLEEGGDPHAEENNQN